MQLLHDLIAELEQQRSLIEERLRLAAELLDTYDPTDPETQLVEEPEPVAPAPPKERTKPGPKPGKPKLAQVACPDCGQMMHPQGLGPHRSRKHPGSAAKPAQPLRVIGNVATFDPDAARARAAAAI